MIEILPLSEALSAQYEEHLDRCRGATLYHSLRYRDFLMAVIGAEAQYLVARRGGRITGVLPLMSRDGAYGRIVNSLPFFGSYGGVLAEDEQSAAALQEELSRQVEDPRLAAATVIDNPFLDETPRPLPSATHHDERIAQFTLLGPNSSFGGPWLNPIDGSARRNLRKAETSGIIVDVDNDALGFLEATHRDNIREIGGTSKPPAFFAALRRVLRPEIDYRLYLAALGGTPVAALLLLYFKEFVEYITPVTLGEMRELQPMAAILHRAMSDAAKEGRRIWNWGGTWLSQTGVYRFKRKWGARELRYRYHIIVRNPALLERTPAELLVAYPHFYVLPFAALRAVDAVPS